MKIQLRISIIFFLVCMAFSAQADRITSAQKQVQKGDYEKAKSNLDKELSKNPNSAGAFHIFAMYFFAAPNAAYHVDSAYLHIQKALTYYPETDEKTLAKWVKAGITSESAQTLKAEIESKAFQDAQLLHTIDAYQFFIDFYAEAPQVPNAKMLRNQIAWQQTLTANDLTAYQNFIAKYPEAEQIPEAIKKRDEIVFQGETSSGTLDTYERFVKQYPESQNIDQALKRIFYMGTFPHSAEAFEQYIVKYPQSSMREFALEWTLAFYGKAKKLGEFIQKYPQYAQKKRLAQMQQVNPRQYVPILQNGLFGYYDEMGELRINFQYESVNPEYLCQSITDDYLVVNRNGRLGIINKLGEEIVPPQFDKVEPLATGVFRVTRNAFSGLVHQSGRELLPSKYDAIEAVGKNFLKIRQNRLWGLSSYSGEIIVEPRYTEIEAENGGFLLFKIGDLMGMASEEALIKMNAERNVRIQVEFDNIEILEDNFIRITKQGKQGIIDARGRAVVPLLMAQLKQTPAGWLGLKEGKWQVYQKNGAWLENFKFENIAYGGSFVAGKQDGKWGIIDYEGKIVSDFKADSIAFIDQTAFVFENKKINAVFFLNPTVKPVDFTLFKGIRPEKGNYPNAQTLIYYEDRQGNKGLFDQNGKKMLSPKYRSVYALDADLINVEQANKYGLVDSTQTLVMPIKYDGIVNFEKDAAYKVLLQNKKYGIYSKTHNIKIEPSYDNRPEIFRKSNQSTLFLVSKGGKYGIIDEKNKALVPFKFANIMAWNDSTVLVQKDNDQWTFHVLQKEKQPDLAIFDEVEIIKNMPEEVIIKVQLKGKWGAWSSKTGQIVAPEYDLIENRGILERPILFGEKRLENNQVEVGIHNHQGKPIWKSTLKRTEYYKMLCE